MGWVWAHPPGGGTGAYLPAPASTLSKAHFLKFLKFQTQKAQPLGDIRFCDFVKLPVYGCLDLLEVERVARHAECAQS